MSPLMYVTPDRDVRQLRASAIGALARTISEAAAAHATGSGYINFLIADEGERVASTYGANYLRLQALKHRYDPGNLFRMNLNIVPAQAAHARTAS